MATTTHKQLSFLVGGATPDDSFITIAGRLATHRDLEKGSEMHLQVVDADGEVIADGYGQIVGVQFKDKLDEFNNITATERVQSLKITGDRTPMNAGGGE